MAAIIQLAHSSVPGGPVSDTSQIFGTTSALTDGNGLNRQHRLYDLMGDGTTHQLTQAGRYNWVRNSGFWFAQRQVPGTATTYSSTTGRAFTADGWAVTNENASATYARVDAGSAPETGLQARYYGQFIKTTSTGKLCISQVIENTDTVNLKNRFLRLQFMAKATTGTPVLKFAIMELSSAGTADTIPGTFISAFNAGGTNPTFGTNLSFLTATSNGQDNATVLSNVASATLSTNWQRFGYCATVNNGSKNLVLVFFSDQGFTATNGFSISQVTLTDGGERQDWSPLAFTEEYVRTARFYQKSFPIDTGPVTGIGLISGEVYGMAGKAGALADFIPIRYLCQMRTTPTITLFNPAAANAQVRDVTAAADCTASAAAASSTMGFLVTATGNAGSAVGNQLAIHHTSDAEL
jgi:hypothetical protein